MLHESARAMLALMLTDGVTPTDCRSLDRHPAEVLEMLECPSGRDRLSGILGHAIGPVEWLAVERQIEAMERCGAGALCWWDRDYPELFRDVARAPAIVFYKGDATLLRRQGVALVGTRRPSPGGVAKARELARALSRNGVSVISGLARGIDTSAHQGALDGALGGVAVMGTGIDVPYPPENVELMMQMMRAGCVMSEQLMGMHASPSVFPRRNRLISSLSHAVVVVEGGARSGALITAKWALEQGRDVGAVPGFPGDFRSAGPNQLIRQGAFLVEGPGDIYAAVPQLNAVAANNACGEDTGALDDNGDRDIDRVRGALTRTPTDADAIAQLTGVAIESVQELLVRLEISGKARRDDGGRYIRE